MAEDKRNELLVPGALGSVDELKTEIANEFNVELGADTTARENGEVGGEMVKRMIQIAEDNMANRRK